jgi:uncharacterized protein (DUF924 family)
MAFDYKLTQEQRSFLYMPFMHSENLGDQEFSIKLYNKLGIENNLKFAVAHRAYYNTFCSLSTSK